MRIRKAKLYIEGEERETRKAYTCAMCPHRLLLHVAHVHVSDAIGHEHSDVGYRLAIPCSRPEDVGAQGLEGAGGVGDAVLVGDRGDGLQERLLVQVLVEEKLDLGALTGTMNAAMGEE
jgi:hypothetical protein